MTTLVTAQLGSFVIGFNSARQERYDSNVSHTTLPCLFERNITIVNELIRRGRQNGS